MKKLRILLFVIWFMNVNAYMKDRIYYDDNEFTYYDEGDDVVPWCEAMNACSIEIDSRHLAVLDNEAYDSAVFDMLDPWGSPRAWIGANELHSQGVWIWVNGAGRFTSSSGYSNWGPNQPDNKDDSEHCLDVNWFEHKWNNLRCDYEFGYVCQLDLLKSTRSDFTVLAFSDTFFDSAKQILPIADAREECENRGMKLIRNIDSRKAKNIIAEHGERFGVVKYWIETEKKNCRSINGNQREDEDCTVQKLSFVCEGFVPHYLKISEKSPKVTESGELELGCTASGYPVPEVTWQIDEEAISRDPSQSIHQIMSEGSSSLVISNAKQSDEGRYRCFATNFINGEKHFVRTFVDIEVMKTEN